MREPAFEQKPVLEKRGSIPADLFEATEQVLREAGGRGITVKLIGGIAFRYVCPSSREGSLARNNNDMDLVVKRKDVGKLRKLMDSLGYEYPPRANVLHPDQILYEDNRNRRQVDIFVDGFQMCHRFDFRKGLEEMGPTLPITELIMTKLQIAEITRKDMQDLGAAFYDFRLSQDKGSIRYDQIAGITSRNWGIWKDFTDNLERLKTQIGEIAPEKADAVIKRANALLGDIEKHPKSVSWRIRAQIGTRLPWHELPARR
ncbi:MAG: hypothetical protein KGH57_02760 [Candidatus Micrarchaeota archaeon]|nr:hypothetical protein [Candidatus Micrarchaeota archaeon]